MPFQSKKQENYLRMHHPSIAKRWDKEYKKGGKVEDYAKGGKVKYYAYGGRNTDTVPAMLTPGEVVLNEDQQEDLGNMMAGGGKAGGGQARAAALFKHIGVPGFKGGGIGGLFEKGRVFLQDYRHRAGERKAKKKALKEHEKNVAEGREKYTITGIVPPEKKGLEPAVVPSNPPLFPHYGAEGRSSLENLVTDSVYGADASKSRYGAEDKKDVLAKYYGGGRVKKKRYYKEGALVTKAEEVQKKEKMKKESLWLPRGNYRMIKDTTFTMPKRKFKEMRKLKPIKK